MLVNPLPELTLNPVEDRGVPNSERFAIYANQTINMGQYGVMLGYSTGENTAVPMHDNLFWFGDGVINQGDWVVIITGKGDPQTKEFENVGGKIYYIYWNREMTMFANTQIVPMLFRVDAVAVGTPPDNKPQTMGVAAQRADT